MIRWPIINFAFSGTRALNIIEASLNENTMYLLTGALRTFLFSEYHFLNNMDFHMFGLQI